MSTRSSTSKPLTRHVVTRGPVCANHQPNTLHRSVETVARRRQHDKGVITFTPKHYDVKRYQQTFEYNDIDVLTDPYMLDAAMAGAAAVMANQVTDEFFGEMAGISNRHYIAGSTVAYDDIVDALAELDREVEDGMSHMGSDGQKAIRKDSDFHRVSSGRHPYTGQFGTLCRLPCISKKVRPSGHHHLKGRRAFSSSKRSDSRGRTADIETKENTVVRTPRPHRARRRTVLSHPGKQAPRSP